MGKLKLDLHDIYNKSHLIDEALNNIIEDALVKKIKLVEIISGKLKVKDDKIEDIKFKTFGCGAAVATSSMRTDLALGKTIDEALAISRGDVADALDGLPPIKMHCSNLAADALHAAIKDYQTKSK